MVNHSQSSFVCTCFILSLKDIQKRCVESKHTRNFWCLLRLHSYFNIMGPYSKFKVLNTLIILNNTNDFVLILTQHIHTNHKISMNRLRTINESNLNDQLCIVLVIFVCLKWLIRREARVRVPGQTSKRNMKSISSAISSQQISGKNSESKLKLPWKVS